MSTTLILPPVAILAAAAADLVERATSTADAQLLNKAIYALQRGLEIETTAGGFLIPSANKSEVYRLTHLGQCSCKGGVKHGHCYHGKMIAIIEEAQMHTMPALPIGDRIAAARRALDLVNELF